ncbi:MAG: YbjN domain-containing protein [Selenomonadaceae bacterium]|nr:YbjN domain-containing protein [Selenomonadaceae bacterium]
MRIIDNFKLYLDNHDWTYDEGTFGDSPCVVVPFTIAETITLRIIFVFMNDGTNETIITMFIPNVAKISDPSKRDELLRLVNEVNSSYKFTRYMVTDDGEVRIQYDTLVESTFDVHNLMWVFANTLRALENEELKKFMRLQWS